MSEEVTVISDLYNEAGQLLEYRREKKPLKVALAEIDNSRIYELCTCSHDIKEHKGSRNIYIKRAGKCRNCNSCSGFSSMGLFRMGPDKKFKQINI